MHDGIWMYILITNIWDYDKHRVWKSLENPFIKYVYCVTEDWTDKAIYLRIHFADFNLFSVTDQWTLFLTRINFYPNMDKWLHAQ